mmetsp:Transcript_20522/g.36877  ORF Transcript_20522/g.36877 Transcript_20522/m.36877 type:complete len:163 (-) Transcript_20522:62-550(-)
MISSRPANTTRLTLLFLLFFDELSELSLLILDVLISLEVCLKTPCRCFAPELDEVEPAAEDNLVSDDNDDRYENVVVNSDSVELVKESESLPPTGVGFFGLLFIWRFELVELSFDELDVTDNDAVVLVSSPLLGVTEEDGGRPVDLLNKRFFFACRFFDLKR